MQYTDFGKDIKEKYNDFFFWHECNSYDALPPDYLGRVTKNSTWYQYKGNHRSRIFTTTKKNYHFNIFPRNRKEKE